MFINTMYDKASSLKIGAAVEKIKKMGEDSVILMDSKFSALPEFYKACDKNDIKPIIGVALVVDEVNVSVVCKNESGYKYISEKASSTMVLEDLKHKDISIIVTGFTNKENVDWLLADMPEVFVGAFDGYDPERMEQMGYLWSERGEDKRLPYFVPNHNNAEDKEELRALRAVKKSVRLWEIPKDIDRGKYVKNFFDTPTPDGSTMAESFPYLVENYKNLHDECTNDYSFGHPKAPNYPFVEEDIKKAIRNKIAGVKPGESEEVLLSALSVYGLNERLESVDASKHKKYKERLAIELDIISGMGFDGYMLILKDLVDQARDLDIPVGPGRGSAAGCLVAYSLRITDIDPMPYGLLFERFLNPERVNMPDIDVDVSQSDRKMLLEFIRSRYGSEHVAQIPAFGTLRAKAAIKDAVRILDYEKIVGERLADLIPKVRDSPATLDEAYAGNPDEIDATISKYKAEKVWDTAKLLEGNYRDLSIHAAGVIISNELIAQKAPLMDINGVKTIQFEGIHTEDVDLIKFDLLGLKTLTMEANTLSLIEKRTGQKIDLSKISFDDPSVYKYISEEPLAGVFQIESDGMQELARKLKPDCFEDIIAMLALYRPGPIESGMIDDFIERKHGRAEISYMFPELEQILKPTYGVIVYQEQVMQIVQTIGGFSLGEADIVRRGMGKKDQAMLDRLKREFVEGATKNGFEGTKSGKLFDLILKFAGYGFNKSHSAAYAVITFRSALLKKDYPVEFTAALLNHTSDNDKFEKYVHEAIRRGIKITPPDINNSEADFIPNKEGELPFALSSVKDVGDGAALVISNERKGMKAKDFEENLFSMNEEKSISADYDSFDDFMTRTQGNKVNKGTMKALVMAGAFDKLGESRKVLFGKLGLKGPEGEDFTIVEKIKQENESLGFILSDPFKNARHIIDKYVLPEFDEIPTTSDRNGKPTFMIVLPISIEKKNNKKGNPFLTVDLLYNHKTMKVFIHDERAITQFSKMSGIDEDGEWSKKPIIIGLTKTLDANQTSVWTNVANVGEKVNQVPAIFQVKEGILKQLFKKKFPPIKSAITLESDDGMESQTENPKK